MHVHVYKLVHIHIHIHISLTHIIRKHFGLTRISIINIRIKSLLYSYSSQKCVSVTYQYQLVSKREQGGPPVLYITTFL